MCRNVVPDRRCGIQNYTLSFQRISVQLSWKCRRWHWPLDLPPPSPFLPPDYETWNLDQPPLVKTAALVHYTGYAVRCRRVGRKRINGKLPCFTVKINWRTHHLPLLEAAQKEIYLWTGPHLQSVDIIVNTVITVSCKHISVTEKEKSAWHNKNTKTLT